jgi:hypothetical protein
MDKVNNYFLTLFWMFPSLTSFSGNGGAKFSKKNAEGDLEPALAGSGGAVVGLEHQLVGEQTTTDTTDGRRSNRGRPAFVRQPPDYRAVGADPCDSRSGQVVDG